MKSFAGFLLAILLVTGCAEKAAREETDSDALRIAYRSTVSSLDPIQENTVISDSIYCNIFEPLVVRDDNLRIVPALAVEWSNPDDRTWEFQLRPDVRFHDGSPLRAEDVRFSIERARKDPGSQLAGSLTLVDRVDVVNAHTVRVITRVPYSILLNKLVDIWILPEKYFSRPAAPTGPPGTGPYRVVAWKPLEFVRLKANDQYWGGMPSIREVKFEAVPDLNARIEGLAKGKYQLLPLLEPSAIANRTLKEIPGVQIKTTSSLATLLLGMDLNSAVLPGPKPQPNPFRDLRVRKALYQAINIDHVINDILHGYAIPATQLVAPKVFGFDENLKRLPYDPGAARKLLKEAGFEQGFDVRLDFSTDRYRNDLEIGSALAKDFAAVGIRVQLNPLSIKDLAPALEAHRSSFFIFGFTLPSADATGVFDFVVHTADTARGYGRNNAGGYSNPEVDRLIEESASTMGADARAKMLMQAMELTMNDLPLIPLHVERSVSASSSRLSWEARPDEFIYCKGLRFDSSGL